MDFYTEANRCDWHKRSFKTYVNVVSVFCDATNDDDGGDVDIDDFRQRFLQPRLCPAAKKNRFVN